MDPGKQTFVNPFLSTDRSELAHADYAKEDPMISYPLPPQLTHERFNSLVTDIYYELTKHGIDPALNMIIGDRDEALDDGSDSPSHEMQGRSEPAPTVLPPKGSRLWPRSKLNASLSTQKGHHARRIPQAGDRSILPIVSQRPRSSFPSDRRRPGRD